MKMKMGDAHNLLTVLNRLDNDASLKFADTVRLIVAININRLKEDVQAYERERNKIYVEMRGDDGRGSINENLAAERDLNMREAEHEFPGLRMIDFDQLKAIKGEHVVTGLASLAPIIKDFDTGAGEE